MGDTDLTGQGTASYGLDCKYSVRFYLQIFFDIVYNMRNPDKLTLLDFKIVVGKNPIQWHQGRQIAVPSS